MIKNNCFITYYFHINIHKYLSPKLKRNKEHNNRFRKNHAFIKYFFLFN